VKALEQPCSNPTGGFMHRCHQMSMRRGKMGITYRALLKGIHQNQIDGDTPFPLNP
jgi:hypothetical protein